MIDVSAIIDRISKLAPDAPCHEHREAAIKLVLAYDGNEESINRVLSFVDSIAQMGGIIGPSN